MQSCEQSGQCSPSPNIATISPKHSSQNSWHKRYGANLGIVPCTQIENIDGRKRADMPPTWPTRVSLRGPIQKHSEPIDAVDGTLKRSPAPWRSDLMAFLQTWSPSTHYALPSKLYGRAIPWTCLYIAAHLLAANRTHQRTSRKKNRPQAQRRLAPKREAMLVRSMNGMKNYS